MSRFFYGLYTLLALVRVNKLKTKKNGNNKIKK